MEKGNKEQEVRHKRWFDDKYNKWLLVILIIAAILRIYILFLTYNQPLWWDEAGYMAKTKKIAFGWTWTDFWNPHKPVLLSWIAVPFYTLGLGELGLRIFIMLLSVLGVYMTYLVGKEFFNKKIALISAFLMSFFWVALFFSGRILTDLPASVILLVSLYYFSKGYIKKEHTKYLWLSGIFFALTFLMRVSIGIMVIPFFLYIFLEEKFKLIKNKNLWLTIALIFAVSLPFLIWLYVSYPSTPGTGIVGKIYQPIDTFIGLSTGRFATQAEGGGAMGIKGIWLYLLDQPYVFGPVLGSQASESMLIVILKYIPLFLILAGLLIVLSDLFLGFDLIFKKENRDSRIKLFLLSAIILIFISFGPTRGYVEQRDMLYIAPFLFCFLGIALFKIKDFLDSYQKYIGILFVIAILLLTAYFQLSWGIALTKGKVTSYSPVMDAALWMKEHSGPSDVIYSESKMQNLYYAERYTLAYGSREGYDPTANKTEKEFFKEASDKKAKFMIISIFEGHAAWFFSNCTLPENLHQFCPFMWAEQHNQSIIPVNAWYGQQNVPFLVIYEFQNYDFKNA